MELLDHLTIAWQHYKKRLARDLAHTSLQGLAKMINPSPRVKRGGGFFGAIGKFFQKAVVRGSRHSSSTSSLASAGKLSKSAKKAANKARRKSNRHAARTKSRSGDFNNNISDKRAQRLRKIKEHRERYAQRQEARSKRINEARGLLTPSPRNRLLEIP